MKDANGNVRVPGALHVLTCALSTDLPDVAVALSLWQLLWLMPDIEGPPESGAFLLPSTCLAWCTQHTMPQDFCAQA